MFRPLLVLLLLSSLAQARPQSLASLENLPEQGLIYHPVLPMISPAPPIQEIFLKTEDGLKLSGWWLPAPPGGPTVLYFHGNGGNLSYAGATLQHLSAAGFGVLAIDYRGYGLSQGHPCEEGLYRDARAAYAECLRRGVRPDRLMIHGQSLGGAIAVHLASERACAGLVLESTFTSMPDMARRVYGRVAAAALATRYASLKTVARVKCPLFVIHGLADDFIPPSMGKALYGAANCPKQLWLVPGATHNNLREAAGAEFSQRLRAFWLSLKH